MAKVKKETVTLAEFDMYDLDGDLTDVIMRLQELWLLGLEQGLTNIRVITDEAERCVYEYGGYQGNYETKWTITIKGEKDV